MSRSYGYLLRLCFGHLLRRHSQSMLSSWCNRCSRRSRCSQRRHHTRKTSSQRRGRCGGHLSTGYGGGWDQVFLEGGEVPGCFRRATKTWLLNNDATTSAAAFFHVSSCQGLQLLRRNHGSRTSLQPLSVAYEPCCSLLGRVLLSVSIGSQRKATIFPVWGSNPTTTREVTPVCQDQSWCL